MLKRVFNQIAEALSANGAAEGEPPDRQGVIRKATAVLMLDVALADKVFDERETDRVIDLIGTRFDLSAADAADLVDMARNTALQMVSLHEFTQVLHENLSEDEKASIVRLLWDVAYADGQLDRYEDALILKISDLLYVSRVRVMRGKHDAEKAARQ